MGDRTRGLLPKFIVVRRDGSSSKDGKHEKCDYFVLDLDHDPFARPALKAYADSCRAEYPLIAGNKSLETAADIGLDNIQVVQSDGHKLVVVQRTDLDLVNDKTAREMAYADNRAGELDLDWDAEQIVLDKDEGIPLEQFFTSKELDAIIGKDDEDKAVVPIKVARPTEIVWVLLAIPIEQWPKHLPVVESLQVDAKFSATVVRPKSEAVKEAEEKAAEKKETAQ
jgi:hypothetical protein